VTSSSKGIGYGIAEALVGHGASVMLVARNVEGGTSQHGWDVPGVKRSPVRPTGLAIPINADGEGAVRKVAPMSPHALR
jgi:NAD(P)-dependent dehydrogenase (short-subunit alcohol dehydrogenase family)